MHHPRFQNIALIAPASRLMQHDHLYDIQKQCQTYQLNITYQHDLTESLPPQQKAEILLEYLFDDTIDTIWAVRGGEGSADIIPYLHTYHDQIKQLKPKTLVGYSDITALLIYFSQTYNWRCIHASGTHQWSNNHLSSDCQSTYETLLKGYLPDLPLQDAIQLNNQPLPSKPCYLTGGNLSLLNISIQDIWHINTDNRLVLIEEVKEPIHVINRSLKYLRRIGVFDKVQGIIIGECYVNESTKELHKTLRRFASDCPYPVIKTNNLGHGSLNYPWSLYYPYQLAHQPDRLSPSVTKI